VKPRLFFDEGRFAADPEGRPAFLVEAAGDGFRVTPSEGLEDEVAPLEELLSGPEGLPFRPEDLAALT
jgi:hypothetical protein